MLTWGCAAWPCADRLLGGDLLVEAPRVPNLHRTMPPTPAPRGAAVCVSSYRTSELPHYLEWIGRSRTAHKTRHVNRREKCRKSLTSRKPFALPFRYLLVLSAAGR